MSKVAFIGAGNMNGAIISGLISKGYPKENVIVTNPSAGKREAIANATGITHSDDNVSATAFADFIILGVKPHLISEVCKDISSKTDVSNKCFISVAAGFPIEKIEQALGNNDTTSVIRVMPNTPAQLGLGAHGAFGSSNMTEQQREVADQLLSATGIVKWVATEADIDHITAVSGSGPAYYFLFMEAMQKQALAFGFSEQDSRELVQQTALGAAQMVIQNSELSISTLRENVTSKGGTTQAALNTFNDNGLTEIVEKSMNACVARAKEMAKGE